MSVYVMSAVWDSGLCSGNTLLALLALADWSNDQGVSFPGIPALAKKSRQSERNVQYCLRELRNAGLLTQELDEKGRRNYRIDLQKLRGAKIAPVQNATSEGCKTEHRGVQNTTPRGAKFDIAIRKIRHEPSRTVIKQPSGGQAKKKSPSEIETHAKQLGRSLGVPFNEKTYAAIEEAIRSEADVINISPAEATKLIQRCAKTNFDLYAKSPLFYFVDAEWRKTTPYALDRFYEKGCNRHPKSGRHPDSARCWGCCVEENSAVPFAMAKAVGQ